MNSLSTYLWKEWREQRATLAVLAAALLAAATAVVAALPRNLASDPLVFQSAVAIALLATIMSTGSDLFARERSGAALGFLERMPAGLTTAFRAKLVYFALALTAAALYGGLLALVAALIRTGDFPQRLLEGSAPWILAILVGVSLWVFAVSAWMPASALTFPGAVLLLAALAWPALLALKGDPLFRPTPLQGLVFALLCLTGAPVSAWAAFVLGSRHGRPRWRAATAGLAVAALSFTPTWAWAAARYTSLANAPFVILQGQVGTNGRFAFLNLTRRPPPGTDSDDSRRWDCNSALLVDLEQGAWSFLGEIDESGFVSASWARGRSHLPEDERRQPLRLLSGEHHLPEADEPEVLLDQETALVLDPGDARARLEPEIGPLDFGLESEPSTYMIYPAGLGQRLRYRYGDRFVELYREPGDGRVFDARDLPRGEHGLELYNVLVRRGRWIARDRERWVWLDPATRECGPLEDVEEQDRVGPLLEDGRIVLMTSAGVELLDLESDQRTALRIVGDPDYAVRFMTERTGTNRSALPLEFPSTVYVSGAREIRLALLDVRNGTLDLGPTSGGARLQILQSDPPRAIALENGDRIVRYDLAADTRDVLFSVGSID